MIIAEAFEPLVIQAVFHLLPPPAGIASAIAAGIWKIDADELSIIQQPEISAIR